MSEWPAFVRPKFPPRFRLGWEQADGTTEWWGPFERGQVLHERDGAVVFHEDGSLPMRLGVLRQDGDELHLFPTGQARLQAI